MKPGIFSETLFRSIEYLDFKVRCIPNAKEAHRTLDKIVNEQEKFRQFERFFPEEWESSTSSLFKPGFYENYTERTNEFFDLINNRLFPLLSFWNDDPDAEFENIYVCSMNLDLCCEDIDFESLRISYVVALLIFMQDREIREYLAARYEVRFEDLPPISGRPHKNLWKLQKTGKQGLFLDLFEIVDHSTGNPWLDTVNCRNGDFYRWNEKNLNFLSRSFAEATELLEQTCLIDEMFDQDPQNTLFRMITLWNQGSYKIRRKTGGL